MRAGDCDFGMRQEPVIVNVDCGLDCAGANCDCGETLVVRGGTVV